MRLSEWAATRPRGPAPAGSVLMHAPSFAFQAPGGGEVQLVETARALEDQGAAVALFDPWTDRLADARLLHLFGCSVEGLELARRANALKVPVALSPISWHSPKALWALSGPWALAKWGARWACPGLPHWRKELLNRADVVLPNSWAEARQLARLFGVPWNKLRVVPNGVKAPEGAVGPEAFREWSGTGECVLYAGRIEPRKNPLGVVRATRALGLPLAVVGGVVPGHEDYARTCEREGRARFLGPIGHDGPLLASAYANARVLALASWFETPGLSALEGALAGRAVAITPYGCTREYFGDLVEYAPPDRPALARLAIMRAWERGAPPALAERVRGAFLWSHVARATRRAHDAIAA